MNNQELAKAARENHLRDGKLFQSAGLPLPFCLFSAASIAFAALVAQAQAHAGLAENGIVDEKTLALLLGSKSAEPAPAKKSASGTKKRGKK